MEIGVERYYFKPVDIAAFVLEISALMKSKLDSVRVVNMGAGYVFDGLRRILLKDSEQIVLTKKELSFVSLLASRVGELVLYDEIKRYVWTEGAVSDTALRTFVKRIRDKVSGEIIKNVPSLGYKIELEPA